MGLKIVVPVDFSESSKNAVRYAMKLEDKSDVDIHLIHAYKIPVNPNVSMIMEDIIEEEVQKNFKRLVEELQLDESKLSFHIIKSQPSHGILKYAEEMDADLIIMGAKGESMLKKLIMGSTTINVARNTVIPVVTIPREGPLNLPQRILYASDLEQVDSELPEVLAFAGLFDATVDVFHSHPETDEVAIDTNETRDDWKKKYGYEKLNFYVEQTRDFNHVIREKIKELNPDLLFFYTKKRDNNVMFLFDKSTSLDLMKSIDLPVLIKQKEVIEE